MVKYIALAAVLAAAAVLTAACVAVDRAGKEQDKERH